MYVMLLNYSQVATMFQELLGFCTADRSRDSSDLGSRRCPFRHLRKQDATHPGSEIVFYFGSASPGTLDFGFVVNCHFGIGRPISGA